METTTTDVKEMNLTELKAAAYDTLAAIEQYQRNLNTLNEEIYKRLNPQPQQ